MRSRTDRVSRATWWVANIAARETTSAKAAARSSSDTRGGGCQGSIALASTPSDEEVPPFAGQFVEGIGGEAEALVFLEPAHEIGARIRLVLLDRGRAGKQQPRLDLGQGRGHHEILPGELEAQLPHELHVFHILPGDLRNGNVQDVEVLTADEIEEEVEGAFECLEEYLQRVGRNVEIARQLGDRRAVHECKRHLLLGRCRGAHCIRGRRRGGSFPLHR